MTSKIQNGWSTNHTAAYWVLDGPSSEDVARAMIEGGRQKAPFFVFDSDQAYQRIQHFRNMMPRVQIFYAMKANDNRMMLKLAVSLGLGFDCASPGEISKLLKMNVSPSSIIYAMATKTPEEMIYAAKCGVKHTTFDSSYELKKFKQYWPDARLLIRIRVDGESVYKLGLKFGCDFETEAIDLLEEAAALGLKVVGVAFHVGSICTSMDSHEVGLRWARALFDHEARAGRGMRILDIGGGFPGDRTDTIDQISKGINRTLEELFPDPNIQVIAEPGRYICESTSTLYCSINNIRHVTKNNKPFTMIYINEGLHGSLRYVEAWQSVKVFKKTMKIPEEELENAILWGPTCDSLDRIMQDYEVRLPRCSPLDWLVFDLQGAYTFTFSTRFSCLEIPHTRAVISLQLWTLIKGHPVFHPSDFVENPDITDPLPSPLPPVPASNDTYNFGTPILI